MWRERRKVGVSVCVCWRGYVALLFVVALTKAPLVAAQSSLPLSLSLILSLPSLSPSLGHKSVYIVSKRIPGSLEV